MFILLINLIKYNNIYFIPNLTASLLQAVLHSKHLIHSCWGMFLVNSICTGHFLSHNLQFRHFSLLSFTLKRGLIENMPNNAPIGQKYLQKSIGYRNPITIKNISRIMDITVPWRFVKVPMGHTLQKV